MEFYKPSRAINCDIDIDTSSVQGKTAFVTGGASGIGEVYVRSLCKAGAGHVLIADFNDNAGDKLATELGKDKATFVHCDVTSWSDQVAAFKKAKEVSPTGAIDIVVANAGIVASDDVFNHEDLEANEPKEPDLSVVKVNLIGVVYTTKLAGWYFAKQFARAQKEGREAHVDQSLVLQASVAGYLDLIGVPQYTLTKFAVRGLMRSLRQTGPWTGMRVNLIAPWYIDTTLIPEESRQAIQESGAEWAKVEDCGPALLRIVADRKVNGRAVGIFPRNWNGCSRGYKDLDIDNFEWGSFLRNAQDKALAPTAWTIKQGQNAGV
ncbi:hypothetical protein LTR62_007284 [Meristemomyces frigidus]|uniref:5'-hydroxyaverantin dehydrogenase n=1 Tax=Meristemomyces frigidus TaxID=1508187 RepID=A0AAN7TBZ7_9PEZI|nr:hypothetical protein LTR62_007284 [Meristemomyces frigidus]